MRSKNLWIFCFTYLLMFLAVGVFFNPVLMKDMPDLQIYEGPLEFSGNKAYENLKVLTSEYASRVAGSEKGRQSAEWVQNYFSGLGMKAYIQEFDYLASKSSDPGNKAADAESFSSLILKSVSDLTINKKGYNVIGISPGKSGEVIVIGAHRDMIGSVQGAEDNGSGTVTMLELARVLANREHYYTYAFLSFDAEEAGLKGSEYFAASNSEMKIKAAVVMDMVGFKDANALSFYQNSTGKGATQLWTMALSNKVLKSMGLLEYDFKARENYDKPVVLFLKMMASRSFGIVNTDSGPFIDRSIPSIGLKSIYIKQGQRGYETGRIHEPADIIEQVSAESLEVSGRFVEKYVNSIAPGGYKGSLSNNMFITYGSKYLGAISFWGLLAVWAIVVLVILAMQLKAVIKNKEGFVKILVSERKWIASVLLLGGIAACFWQVLRFDFGRRLPVFIMALFYILAFIAGIVAIIILRFKYLKRYKGMYMEMTEAQRIMLNMVYIASFFLLTITANPFVAICITIIPILVLGRVSYKKEWLRVVWILLLFMWSLVHLGLSLASLQSYIFDISSIKVLVISFTNITIWAFSIIYIISTPPMPVRAKTKPVISSAQDIGQG